MIYFIVLTFNWEAYVIIKLKQLLANSKINASKKFLKKKKWKERPNLKTKKFFTRINHLKKIRFFFKHCPHNPHFKDILSLLFLFWTNITVWLTNCDKLWIFILKTGGFEKKPFWPLFFFNSVFFQKKTCFFKKKQNTFFFKKTLLITYVKNAVIQETKFFRYQL